MPKWHRPETSSERGRLGVSGVQPFPFTSGLHPGPLRQVCGSDAQQVHDRLGHAPAAVLRLSDHKAPTAIGSAVRAPTCRRRAFHRWLSQKDEPVISVVTHGIHDLATCCGVPSDRRSYGAEIQLFHPENRGERLAKAPSQVTSQPLVFGICAIRSRSGVIRGADISCL